jgi:hypothetical protein
LRRLVAVSLVGVVSAAALTASAVSAAPAGHCRPLPQSIPLGRLVQDGSHARVRVGAIVYVVLGVPEKYDEPRFPRAFPWLAPSSSAPRVLAPVALCQRTGAATLRVKVAAFRAVRPGRAALLAPLSRPWRGLHTRLHPYRASVRVVR